MTDYYKKWTDLVTKCEPTAKEQNCCAEQLAGMIATEWGWYDKIVFPSDSDSDSNKKA